MNRSISAALVAVGLLVGSAAAADAAVVKSPLKCFTGNGGTCSLTASGGHIAANTPMGYAGLYYSAKKTSGERLANVDYAFSWTGVNGGGGAPRLSIPIDDNGDRVTDGYAFIDWNSCGNAPTGGTVSTTDAACGVYYGSAFYINWDAFAAANPTYRISKDLPFVIVDFLPADVQVSNVVFSVG